MKWQSITAVALALFVAACHRGDAAGPDDAQAARGRYAGVGVFDAAPGWHRMANVPMPTDDKSARIADDDHVIVVIDSRTGEVRECGDHSGFCVALSPWAAGRNAPALPVALTSHADPESGIASEAATSAAN